MTQTAGAHEQHESTILGRRVSILAFVLVVVGLVWISLLSVRAFERELIPELRGKAFTIGDVVVDQLVRALNLGIPFEELVGVDEFFAEVLENHRELPYLALTDGAGAIVHWAGGAEIGADAVRGYLEEAGAAATETAGVDDTALYVVRGSESAPCPGDSLAAGGTVPTARAAYCVALSPDDGVEIIGVLHIGVGRHYVRERQKELVYDILVVMLVSLLVTFEFKLLFVFGNVTPLLWASMRILQAAGDGDFSRRVKVRSGDEIGRLVRSVNVAVQKVNSRYRQALAHADAVRRQANGRLSSHAEETMERLRQRFQFEQDGGEATGHAIRRSDTLIYVRMPLFLFVVAEELSRAFFPVYVRELYEPFPGITQELVIGLPITAFMLVAAIATPFAGRLVDRHGARRVFLWGLVPAACGFVGTALATDLPELLAWRALTALGYGSIFIACQGFVIANSDARSRTSGMVMYVGAIMAADICGPAIGGVLADRIGFRETFLVSAGLCILSGLFVHRLLGPHEEAGPVRPALRLAHLRALLSNARFTALVLFAAIPAKMILTGFLFFIAPLYLHLLGSTPSEIGRTIMTYGIASIVLGPVVAGLADRWGRRIDFVVVGGLVAGAGMLLILRWENHWAVLAGVLLLGIAHAISITPQGAAVLDVCARECESIGETTVLSIFRLLERMGAVLGPMVAGALIGALGYPWAMAILGSIVLLGAVLLALVFAATRPAAEPAGDPA